MSKQYFRVRAFPNHIDRFKEFIDGGFIAIGWPEIEDVTKDSKSSISTKLSTQYPDLEGRALGLTTGFFVRLLSMREGDIVLIPYNNESVTLAEVTQKYSYNPNFIGDHTAHRVGIKVLKKLKVTDLPPKLKKSIDTITTLISLKKYDKEIDALLSNEHMTIKNNNMKNFISDNTEKKIALYVSNNVNLDDLKEFIDRIDTKAFKS